MKFTKVKIRPKIKAQQVYNFTFCLGTDGIEALIIPELNSNNKNGKLLLSILCSALYPNVIQILSPKTKFHQTTSGAMAKTTAIEDLRFRTKNDGFVNIHPSSVIAKAGQAMESAYIGNY